MRVERGDRELEAARERERRRSPRSSSARRRTRGASRREPCGRPRQHRRRAIDADDDVPGAQQRHHQPARAAAEVEDRTAALVGQRAVEADVVAPPPVLPVVEQRRLRRDRRAGIDRGNVRVMSDAIVLLSGGIDSATALAMTRATGRRCHALSFRYGQRHAVELAAAARVAAALGAASHEIIDLDLRAIGGSALTADIAVPKGRERGRDRQRHPRHLRPGAQHDLPGLRDRAGRGPRAPRRSSSASTCSTRPATPTAVPNGWRRCRRWRASAPRRASSGGRSRSARRSSRCRRPRSSARA